MLETLDVMVFDNIEALNVILAISIEIFFIFQAWNVYKKEKLGAIYSILYLFGVILIPAILFNSLSAYKPNKYPLPEFLQITYSDVINTMIALILGVTSITLSQKRGIDEKNERISRDVASPLFLEIEEIKDEFLKNMTTIIDRTLGNYTSIWADFNKTKSNNKIIALDISNDLNIFYEQCNEYSKNLDTTYKNNVHIIKKELNLILKLYTEIVAKPNRLDFFRIKYTDSYGKEHNFSLSKFIIFKRNPIAYLNSQFMDFNINNVLLKVYAERHDRFIEIKYIDEYYNNMVDKIEESFADVKEIQKLREDRIKLIDEADKLMNILRKYIISI